MKWMRNYESPAWGNLLGCLLLAFGCWINILINVLLGVLLMCLGSWLMRWWFEVPADHPRFQKMSQRRFNVCRSMSLASSWGMLILTVVVVFLSIFDVLP